MRDIQNVDSNPNQQEIVVTLLVNDLFVSRRPLFANSIAVEQGKKETGEEGSVKIWELNSVADVDSSDRSDADEPSDSLSLVLH